MSGKLIGCVGGAGAPGVTTVACQLAAAISGRSKLDTALVDMDMDGSPLSAIWEVNETAAMGKLYEMSEVGQLSDDVLETAMQVVNSHLHVVSGFRGTELGPQFRSAQGIHAIHGINGRVEACVLDIGRPRYWSAFDILKEMDVICWVVTPTPEGALAWRRIWNIFDGRGLPKTRMVAVINEYNHPRALQGFAEEWTQRPGIPIVARVPYLPKLLPGQIARLEGGKVLSGNKDWLAAYDVFLSRALGASIREADVGSGGGGVFKRFRGGS